MKKSEREAELYKKFILEFTTELKKEITSTISYQDDMKRNKYKFDVPTQEHRLALFEGEIAAYRSVVHKLMDVARESYIPESELGFTGLKGREKMDFDNYFRK